MAKKWLKTVLVILGIILLAAAALILWLSVTEFKPGDVMDVKVEANSESTGFQTSCSGSAHTRSFIIPTHCGRISLRRNWTRRSKRITAATAVSEV